MGYIIDCKAISDKLREEIKASINPKNPPFIDMVAFAGFDNSALIYFKNVQKACSKIGIKTRLHLLSPEMDTKDCADFIESLWLEDNITDGIIIQNHVPSHINREFLINKVSNSLDIDCAKIENLGKVFSGVKDNVIYPCTPLAIMQILKAENINLNGTKCVVIGRSNTVGRPIASMLEQANATVTLCHSHTPKELLRQLIIDADVVISAVGQHGIIESYMVKDSVIIDVGINQVEGKIVGDVAWDIYTKWECKAITPVPNGVGVMTVTALMQNLMKNYLERIKTN